MASNSTEDSMVKLIGTMYHSKTEVREVVQAEALVNGFAVTTRRSNKRNIYIQCVHGGEYKNCHDVTEKTRVRKRSSHRNGCPWVLYASYTKKAGRWVIRRVDEAKTHEGHTFDYKAGASYYQHRRVTGDISRRIATMTSNAIKPAKIWEELNGNDEGVIINIKDIYNFRQKIFEDDRSGAFSKLFQFLINNGYIVRYRIDKAKKELEALLVTHKIGVENGRRFHEVVSMDATYQTNSSKMPLINVVGVSNLGTTRLRNILIASAVVVNEKTESYHWIVQTLRSVIWPSGNVGLFITDNEQALINAIESIFPDSTHILCGWHISQHLISKFAGCFPKKSDKYTEVKATIHSMVYTCKDEQKFDAAVEQYRTLADEASTALEKQEAKAKNTSASADKKIAKKTSISARRKQKIIKYLERVLEYKEKWAAPFAGTIMNLGVRTTSRTEGTHWIIKDTMETTGSLYRTFKAIHKVMVKSFETQELEFINEKRNRPVFSKKEAAALSNLFGNVCFFALYRIRNELNRAINNEDRHISGGNCTCTSRLNYNLPCQHTLHLVGIAVDLDKIPKRWCLTDYPNTVEVINPYSVIDEQLTRLISTINDKLRLLDTEQEKADLLKALEEVLEVETEAFDLAEVTFPESVIPKGRPKKTKDTRLPSRFELEEKNPTKYDLAQTSDDILNRSNDTDNGSLILHPRKRDKEGLHIENHKKRARTEFSKEEKKFDFFVHPMIPRDCFHDTVSIDSDGWCGFRTIAYAVKGDQHKFMDVKREMLDCLNRNKEIYSKHFVSMYDLERLEEVVAYGLNLDPNPDGKYPGCPPNYWFYTPSCVQLAADTFRVPIAVYPDTYEETSRINSGPPLLYLPFEGPMPKAKPLPIVMQFVSGCHWSTLQMSRAIKMEWPVIERCVVEACKGMGETQDLRKKVWRYLSIKKAVYQDSASVPITLD